MGVVQSSIETRVLRIRPLYYVSTADPGLGAFSWRKNPETVQLRNFLPRAFSTLILILKYTLDEEQGGAC
jgi:hypothetical protein